MTDEEYRAAINRAFDIVSEFGPLSRLGVAHRDIAFRVVLQDILATAAEERARKHNDAFKKANLEIFSQITRAAKLSTAAQVGIAATAGVHVRDDVPSEDDRHERCYVCSQVMPEQDGAYVEDTLGWRHEGCVYRPETNA